MRVIACSLLAAVALSGCVTPGYYRDGSADYYYERDYSHSGYHGGYVGHYGGPGYYGYYDPYWSAGAHFGYGGWPYLGYGYGSYYSGWPYFGYSSWYDSWWGVGYNDWSWHRHQQALARQRTRDVGSDAAGVAALRGTGRPDRDGVTGAPARSSRLAPGASAGPDRWGDADAARQLRTQNVDPYYGAPRVRRGEGPMRDQPAIGARGPQREGASAAGLRGRDDRPVRVGPAFDDRRFGAPAPQRAPGAMREAGAAAAPNRGFTPAPSRSFAPAPMERSAPSFTPRSEPSSSGSSRTRTNDR